MWVADVREGFARWEPRAVTRPADATPGNVTTPSET
jgi:hypothetical protein